MDQARSSARRSKRAETAPRRPRRSRRVDDHPAEARCQTTGCADPPGVSGFLRLQSLSLRSQPTRNERVCRRFGLGCSWVGGEKLTLPPEAGVEAESAVPEAVLVAGVGPTEGRSLGQIAWIRLKRDKVALVGGAFLIFLILVAILAPLIVKYLGDPPDRVPPGIHRHGGRHADPDRSLRGYELGSPDGH